MGSLQTDVRLRLRSRWRWQDRSTGGNGEWNRESRAVGLGTLLLVPIREPELAVQHFDHMVADVTGRWNRQPPRPVRRYRGDPAGPPVVVQQVEGHFQAAVADALYINRDRGAERSTPRRDVDGHVDRIAHLRHQTIALLQHDVVVEPEVLRCLECGLQASGGIAADARHLVVHRHELAPLVLGFGHVPPPDRRPPDYLEFLVGR